MFGQFPFSLSSIEGAYQIYKGRLLILFLHCIQLVGEKLLARVPENILCQVGQGLKAGTHIPFPTKVVHPRDQDVVALACQCLNMAQIDFSGQTGLVNSQGSAFLKLETAKIFV